jgi:hypothetical protein
MFFYQFHSVVILRVAGEISMKFTATVELMKKTATGIQVPEEVVFGLGSSKKPAVKVTIGGYTYRSTVASMGGRFLIPISSENRIGAGVAAGDVVEVDIVLDTEPRELQIPADFSDALNHDAAAKLFFEGLSYSNKRRFVLNIDSAKSEETRLRRIEKSISLLRVGKLQ